MVIGNDLGVERDEVNRRYCWMFLCFDLIGFIIIDIFLFFLYFEIIEIIFKLSSIFKEEGCEV